MFLGDFRKMILHHKKTLLSLATTSAAACNRLLFALKDVRCGVDGRLPRPPASSLVLRCGSLRLQCFSNLINNILEANAENLETVSRSGFRARNRTENRHQSTCPMGRLVPTSSRLGPRQIRPPETTTKSPSPGAKRSKFQIKKAYGVPA